MSAVEVTTKYATTVDDLPSAWAFVMEYVDRCGPKPSITISPVSSMAWSEIGDEDAEWRDYFEVVVSGMSEETE